MNRDADLPSSSEVGGEAQPTGSPGTGDGAGDESGEGLDLPLDALLDWGTDPSKADDELEKELETQSAEAILAAERDEYLDALRRLQADFDNFRKRSLRQQTELLERATEGLCMQLLPVLDALDLATDHLADQADTNEAVKALEQLDSLLRATLAREGLERIDAVGVPFDPTVHDAVGHLPAEPSPAPDSQAGPDEAESDESPGLTVARVMRAGYKMKSKVLRPAMVLVGG
ncbi:MAG: nucleotide exchange factor GrpE [Acidimicrobiales bacterium]